MSKKTIALLLAAAMTAAGAPAAQAASALSNETAGAYYQALLKQPEADSYLVDFDGNGTDELLLVWEKGANSYDTLYEVWCGTQRVASSNFGTYLAGGIYSHTASNGKKYLGVSGVRANCSSFESYTIEHNRWVKKDTLLDEEHPITGATSQEWNGKQVTYHELTAAREKYKEESKIIKNSGHSVQEQLMNATKTPTDRKDVLSGLMAGDKQKLFQRLLCNVLVSGGAGNYQTLHDQDIIRTLELMQLNTQFPFAEYGGDERGHGVHTVFSKADFDRLVGELFGRTIDVKKLTHTTMPDDNRSFYDQGKFYLLQPQMGYVVTDRADAQHLYALDGNRYFASFKHWQKEGDDPAEKLNGIYVAVVKKNADDTWTLLRLYPNGVIPTDAELDAYVQPSAWAKAEIYAAQAAGLVPALAGDPAWQDTATRLQFAQLAVSLCEKATGKTLSAAPATTFSDCSEPAVLKAYAAGIIGGTGAGKFEPNGIIDREQLATMLARAIVYLEKETGRKLLTNAADLSSFSDRATVSDWATDSIGLLAANGIMQGTSAVTLSPKAPCAVEQGTLLSYRVYTKLI